jgi:hypothetical protein
MSKVRIWEDYLLSAALKHCVQLRDNIEELAQETKTQPYEMPASLVPTDLLYNLANSYTILYEVLLQQDLKETGNTHIPKSTIQ